MYCSSTFIFDQLTKTDTPNEGRQKINSNFLSLTGLSSCFVTGNLTGGTIYGGSISADTYYSGSTLLETVIHSMIISSTPQGSFLSLSGGTVAGDTSFAANLSAGTYYSGSTPLETIIQNIVSASTPVDVFLNNITVTLSGGKTLGKYTNGQVIPSSGKTFEQVMNLIAVEFLVPTFSAFAISAQSTQLESGDQIVSGNKTFTWSSTNSGNITTNSILIRNQTANITLSSGLTNDGSEVINLPSNIVLTGVSSQVFRIMATDTQSTGFQRDFTVSSGYKVFYGDSVAAPANSANVRALANNRFTNAGNTFTLNTGAVNKIFTVAMPATNNLVSVFDATASNADITSQYVMTTFTVNDFAGNPVSYKIYTMSQAIPYSTSHAHTITIS